jgi:hypothetical protein
MKALASTEAEVILQSYFLQASSSSHVGEVKYEGTLVLGSEWDGLLKLTNVACRIASQ